jgi:putative (di)nucleoside polyphosphate hydrolase
MSETPIDPASLPYRPCVAMMLFNCAGKVFVAKRIDQTLEGWQMPQGGIDQSEQPQAAALRELEEEIGTRNVAVLREHNEWLTYDLPPHLIGLVWGGRYRGQKVRWFALRFLGADSEIDLKTAHPEFSEWRWVDLTEVMRSVVPFKRDIYQKAIAAFSDFAKSE